MSAIRSTGWSFNDHALTRGIRS